MKFILVFALLAINVFALDGPEIKEKIEKATFRIVQSRGSGTGFVINKEGYLITNNHVVEGCKEEELKALNSFYKYRNIKIVKLYPKKDIAILKIKDYNENNFITLQEPKTIKVGHISYSYGYPGVSDTFIQNSRNTENLIDGTLKSGEVSKIVQKYANYTLIETSSFINPGNSGGPLVSKRATLLGINSMGPKAMLKLNRSSENSIVAIGSTPQGVFWAIHVKELIKVLNDNGIKYTVSDETLDTKHLNNVLLIILLVTFFALVSFFVFSKNKKAYPIEKILSKQVREKVKEILERQKIKEEEDIQENIEENNNTYILYSDELEFEIKDGGPLVIGRSNSSEICINNSYISREHCIVEIKNDTLYLQNLEPTNGTFVNERKLNNGEIVALRDGDIIIFGGNIEYKVVKAWEEKIEKLIFLARRH